MLIKVPFYCLYQLKVGDKFKTIRGNHWMVIGRTSRSLQVRSIKGIVRPGTIRQWMLHPCPGRQLGWILKDDAESMTDTLPPTDPGPQPVSLPVDVQSPPQL